MKPAFATSSIAVIGAFLMGCMCRYGPGSSQLSKDQRFDASSYYSSCLRQPEGMEVSLDSAGRLPYGPGNVFSVILKGDVANTWAVSAAWGDSGLYVDYDSRVEIRRQERVVHGIRIIYRPYLGRSPRP